MRLRPGKVQRLSIWVRIIFLAGLLPRLSALMAGLLGLLVVAVAGLLSFLAAGAGCLPGFCDGGSLAVFIVAVLAAVVVEDLLVFIVVAAFFYGLLGLGNTTSAGLLDVGLCSELLRLLCGKSSSQAWQAFAQYALPEHVCRQLTIIGYCYNQSSSLPRGGFFHGGPFFWC
jgi:hypothetical protein